MNRFFIISLSLIFTLFNIFYYEILSNTNILCYYAILILFILATMYYLVKFSPKNKEKICDSLIALLSIFNTGWGGAIANIYISQTTKLSLPITNLDMSTVATILSYMIITVAPAFVFFALTYAVKSEYP
ncbi:hypothetical protein ACWIW6_09910 [Ursidibacter sp. B-7004-1]